MKKKKKIKYPKAKYKTIMLCPECGWYGDNRESDATFHECLEKIRGNLYKCTACGCVFKK